MGKNKHYADDYTGDVRSIRKSHKKFRVLLSVLCVSGVIAAGSATYVLMNPAQTMTKEGIDEMDPNEDFVIVDEDAVLEDIIPAEDLGEEEDLDAIPLVEEADEDEKAPADAISAADDADASKDAADAALPGTVAAEEDALPVEAEETESELPEEMQAAADVTAAAESEAAQIDEAASSGSEAEEIIGTAEPAEGQSAEASDPEETADLILEESGETVVEEVQSEASAEEEVQTEPAAAEAEIAEEESEEAIAGEEAVQTEEAAQPEEIAETELSEEETEAAESEEAEAAESESEEPAAESGTETAEPETQASEIREKSKDEVYVETEGERLDAKWIDSVGLEIRTESGWSTAQTEGGAAIEVDADQTLRFRVTYTVQPGTLSPEMRTLIYQIPQEIKKVDESYGEIVDANDQVLANYAIDETGLIRVTFMEDIAERNEAGTKVTCQIEFRTKASNLVQ